MRKNQTTGSWGERIAASYIRRHLGRIIEMNYKTRFGEVDIIAEKGRYILFVEVKTRKTDAFGTAAEYVDAGKRRRILITAEQYLTEHPTERQPRFDVVEIYAPNGQNTLKPEIKYYPNAFGADY